jgi:hypothetical protein
VKGIIEVIEEKSRNYTNSLGWSNSYNEVSTSSISDLYILRSSLMGSKRLLWVWSIVSQCAITCRLQIVNTCRYFRDRSILNYTPLPPPTQSLSLFLFLFCSILTQSAHTMDLYPENTIVPSHHLFHTKQE